jgi:hypothetical protein
VAEPQPYINRNPKATTKEVDVGTKLDALAQKGQLRDVTRVEGAPELRGDRSGDYRLVRMNGSRTQADLYEPETAPIENIPGNITDKNKQAETVIVDIGHGQYSRWDEVPCRQISKTVFDTPGHRISRMIFYRRGAVVLDLAR